MFKRKYQRTSDRRYKLSDIEVKVRLDAQVKASGYLANGKIDEDERALLEYINDRKNMPEAQDGQEESDEDNEEGQEEGQDIEENQDERSDDNEGKDDMEGEMIDADEVDREMNKIEKGISELDVKVKNEVKADETKLNQLEEEHEQEEEEEELDLEAQMERRKMMKEKKK